MPITVGVEIRRLDEHEFGEVVFETMRQIFSVHDEFGRFFDEKIYERELAFRIAGAQTEVPIDVTFDGFCKRYFVDLLVAGGAIFELKSVGGLYEEAATHFCGRNAEPLSEIEIHAGNRSLGMQKVRLADPLTALKVTALNSDFLPDFECHARRFLAHTSLRAIQWINITRPVVQFKTLK
jgi:hypothetical protein